MNKSGEAVSKVVNYYKIYPNDIWVIYDDVDLPLAELRIRPEGSAGGHQGMASVIKQMGTEKINRVKIGIGDNRQAGMSSEDYVLQNFSAAEKKEIDKTLADLLQRIAEILQ